MAALGYSYNMPQSEFLVFVLGKTRAAMKNWMYDCAWSVRTRRGAWSHYPVDTSVCAIHVVPL